MGGVRCSGLSPPKKYVFLLNFHRLTYNALVPKTYNMYIALRPNRESESKQ